MKAACAMLVLGTLLLACKSSGEKRSPPIEGEGAPRGIATEIGASLKTFERIADDYFEAGLDFSPANGASMGLHAFDGKLPKRDAETISKEIARIEKTVALLEILGELPPAQEFERDLILADARDSLFWLRDFKAYSKDPMAYVGALELTDYISREYDEPRLRAEAIIRLTTGTASYLRQAQKNLPDVMPRTWIQTALLQIGGMIDFARKDVPLAFASLNPQIRGNLAQALANYTAALKAYQRFLTERLGTASDDFAIGPELFSQMLAATAGIEIDLERLLQIGTADMERNLTALDTSGAKLAKKTLDAVEKVRLDRPARNQVLAEAEKQSAEMRQFIIEKKIASIPSDDRARVLPSPPFMRWNFAFLSSAGVFETKELPSFYYISPPDPKWPKKMQEEYIASRADLLFVTIHEVWPGHFLHHLHIKRHPSRYARAYCSYAASEGWAHYVEEMMWDAGVGNGDPKIHIGQLQNALLRNVRFIAAIGMHTKGMQVEEAKRLFIEKGFQDEASAEQQAIRGTFDPGYLNYTLGKLMIRKLHDDWKAKVGSEYSLQKFHDEFLSHACAPIAVTRKYMLGADAGPAL